MTGGVFFGSRETPDMNFADFEGNPIRTRY